MAALLGPTPRQRALRWVLALGYMAIVAAGFLAPWQPRFFWTMLLPMVPILIVLIGFSNWRNICPLAFFGELGRKLNRGAQRRVPAWFERWFFPLTFSILLVMLVLRLVATNGDGRWLSGLLIGLAVAAAAVNLVFTGKSWCNFFCPVGFVERVYTEPNSLAANRNSQCAKCTACKKHCPDIDQENAYWKDVSGSGRRFAVYSFPGLVFAFYFYYWLRGGEWAAYFDGRWTREVFEPSLVTGPGFVFAPQVPAVAAAAITLVGLSLMSFALLAAVERIGARWSEDAEKLRHRVLGLAAFSAFSIFYFFAGAPTLRQLDGGTQAVAFVAPMLGTVFLAKRWRRTREHFIGDQGVKRLLRNWPFDEPPPSDAAEVYGFIKASEHARDKELEAYESTVRDMIADGLVGPGELRLLEGVRKRLGVSEKEHEKIFARLNEEERDLFDGTSGGIEARAQLEGYQAALTEALLRGAARGEIEELRENFGISAEDHERALEGTRGASGDLLTRARRQLERALEIRGDLATIGATTPTAARVFLANLLRKSRTEALHRVLELLEVAGDAPMIQGLRTRLFSRDAARRGMALELLAQACPGADTLVADLEPLLADQPPPPETIDAGVEPAVLDRLCRDPNPFRRAAAVWAATAYGEGALAGAITSARSDNHPLVAETAARFADGGPSAPRSGPLSTIETMHFLYAVPLFTNLEPDDLYEIALFAFEQTIEPPATICEAGDPRSDALYVILEGRAQVELPGEGDEIINAAKLGPGNVVGELSVLDGNPRSATVRPVDGPVRVLRVPGQPFRSGVLRRHHIAQTIFGALTAQIRELARQLGGR